MMTLKENIKAIARWYWLVLLPVVIVALYIALTYQPPPPLYQVALRLATGGDPAEPLSEDYDRYYAWLSSEYIANGLADLAVTQGFAQRAAERLTENNLRVSGTQLHHAIASDNTQSVAIIYLTWHDADELATIAPIIGQTLIDVGGEFYPQMQRIGPVARIVDMPAPQPIAPSIRNQILQPGLRLVLASALGIGMALLVHYVDPFVRTEEDIKSHNITILTQIPRS
jgi:capsular polysaccharide biosynthesis protein